MDWIVFVMCIRISFQWFLGCAHVTFSLAQMLQRIAGANLTLNLSVCLLMLKLIFWVIILGQMPWNHELRRWRSCYGFHVLHAVDKSFLGLATYYRRYLRNFSELALMFTELLKKWEKLIWSEDAFAYLKSRLASGPILGPQDFEKNVNFVWR